MSGNYATERKGIAAIQAKLADLELIWRETPSGDFGIDGHIEFLDDNSEPTGMLLGVQVKSGLSYFHGETDYTVSYTANAKHQKYWEHYPVPVLLILYHPNNREAFWVDVRQEFRTGKAPGNKIVIPKSNSFMAATVQDLFKNAGLTHHEYVRDLSGVLDYMLTITTENADFDISFFDLFCLGMTNICRSLYFGMDLAIKIANHKLLSRNSELGAGLGSPEYAFLESYIRFIVSQNLVHANYSDLLIDMELREMVPKFIVPLSRRGSSLKQLIAEREDELVKRGNLKPDRYRAVQEAFVEVVEMSMFSRFKRVNDVSRNLRLRASPTSSAASDLHKDGDEPPVAEYI